MTLSDVRGQGMKFWSGTVGILGLFGVVVPVCGAIGTRMDWWTFETGFLCLGVGALLGSVAAIGGVIGISVAISIVSKGRKIGNSWIFLGCGTILGGTVIGFIYLLFVDALAYPPIHQISTDVENPPRYSKVLELREAGSNSLIYTQDIARVQQQTWPHLKSLVYERLSPEESLAIATSVAESLNWNLLEPSDLDRGGFIVEAVATTFWYGFKDDIVIRVLPHENGQGSVVDLRSTSRVGVSDLGANAKRIERFSTEFERRSSR